MSLFITFEGGEGSGKSVQAKALQRKLRKLDLPVILTFEPGGTPSSTRIGRLLKWTHDEEILPITELLLFNAARAQLVNQVIKPKLAEGSIVICDRYSDSTTVYQSYGRGLDLKQVMMINSIATTGLKPDLTLLLDIPAGEGLTRKKAERYDRFEKADREFHQRIRDGYLKLAAEEPKRWFIIDATQQKKTIEQIIWQKVSSLLAKRGLT